MKTLHVNLFAAPGHGKSYVAESVSSALRLKGFSVELVREYAKELHWQGSLNQTEQLIITTEQYRRQSEMDGKVDVVVTDCAIPMGVLHAPDSYRYHLLSIVQILTGSWDQMQVLVERDITQSYSERGRNEKMMESIAHQHRIRELLVSLYSAEYTVLDLDNQTSDDLVDTITLRLQEKLAA